MSYVTLLLGCCKQQVASGGCTTPGFDGSCPPGTYPNDGRCCPSGGCSSGYSTVAAAAKSTDTTTTPSLLPAPGEENCPGGPYDPDLCSCPSPILLDLSGDGFRLSDADGGVSFDLTSDGQTERISWTLPDTDDAWLTLDRNANGTVDDGQELFGNFTPQPPPPADEERNGFLALALYDRTGNGGNADGVIDARDSIFSRLRLWRDTNHNGVSEREELHGLESVKVVRLHLEYKASKRRDEHGNSFRYRAKVDDAKGAKVNRWAWDVFLVTAQ